MKRIDFYKRESKYFSLFVLGVVFLCLLTLFLVLAFLKNIPAVAEAWTRGFARVYNAALVAMTSWIPFSVTEIFFWFYISFCVFVVFLSVYCLFRKQWKRSMHGWLIFGISLLAVLTNYTASCEFAYLREKAPLPYYETQVENEEFLSIYNYFASDLATVVSSLEFEEEGDVVLSKDLRTMSQEIEDLYHTHLTDEYYYSSNAIAKPMLSSSLYRELQIVGVTNGSLAEANVNFLNVQADIPFALAHEFAHTKGVMREDEANQVAFYVLLQSGDPLYRFSAYLRYFYQINSLKSKSYMPEEDRNNALPIPNEYSKALRYESRFWQEHDLLGKVGDFFNDLYIRMSGVEEGTSSYSGGTTSTQDPVTRKLNASQYQKLFFGYYYSHCA